MTEDTLGPMPEPQVTPPDDSPGGADAIHEETPFSGDIDDKVGRDLQPEANPEAEDKMPDEITEPDDKQQENEDDEGDSASESSG